VCFRVCAACVVSWVYVFSVCFVCVSYVCFVCSACVYPGWIFCVCFVRMFVRVFQVYIVCEKNMRAFFVYLVCWLCVLCVCVLCVFYVSPLTVLLPNSW